MSDVIKTRKAIQEEIEELTFQQKLALLNKCNANMIYYQVTTLHDTDCENEDNAMKARHYETMMYFLVESIYKSRIEKSIPFYK